MGIESPVSLVQQSAESESESSDSEDEDVQTQFDTFPVGYDGSHFYERVVPDRFSKDTDDIFMRSMITAYAHEEKSKVVEHDDGTKTGGDPTGKFWMNKEDALSAAKEVRNPQGSRRCCPRPVHRHLLRQVLGSL